MDNSIPKNASSPGDQNISPPTTAEVNDPGLDKKGMWGALSKLLGWIDLINIQEGVAADEVAHISQVIAEYSNEQSRQQQLIAAQMNGDIPNDPNTKKPLTGDALQKWTTGLSENYTNVQTLYTGYSTKLQADMDSKEREVEAKAKTTTGDYTNAGTLAQMPANIASCLRA